jgi:hypothetical protein
LTYRTILFFLVAWPIYAERQSLLSECTVAFTINSSFDQFISSAPALVPKTPVVAFIVRWKASRSMVASVEGSTDHALSRFLDSLPGRTFIPLLTIKPGCDDVWIGISLHFVPGKAINKHKIDRWIYTADKRILVFLK